MSLGPVRSVRGGESTADGPPQPDLNDRMGFVSIARAQRSCCRRVWPILQHPRSPWKSTAPSPHPSRPRGSLFDAVDVAVAAQCHAEEAALIHEHHIARYRREAVPPRARNGTPGAVRNKRCDGPRQPWAKSATAGKTRPMMRCLGRGTCGAESRAIRTHKVWAERRGARSTLRHYIQGRGALEDSHVLGLLPDVHALWCNRRRARRPTKRSSLKFRATRPHGCGLCESRRPPTASPPREGGRAHTQSRRESSAVRATRPKGALPDAASFLR